MKDRHNKNGLLYFLVVFVAIIVYLVIHLYCNGLREDILKNGSDYENNLNKQPINNIITTETKIKLNTNKITMTIGSKTKIIAVIEPYNTTNVGLIWESSDPSIATVDSNGNIVALREGTVIITVKTKDGKISASCTITVEPNKVDDIKLYPSSMSLKINSSATIVAVTSPDDVENNELIWESSNPNVATVDSNGKVTGISIGQAIITAKTKDGEVASTCVVNIVNGTVDISNIKFDKDKVSVKVGSTSQLLITIKPDNATERDLIWKSSNTDIVTVDKNGKITGIKPGTATITVQTKDGKVKATCVVTVEPIEVDKIILNTNEISIKINTSEQLTATVEPDNATDKELIWTSSDPSIVVVDSNGKITGIKEGEAIITVQTKDGKVKEECKVIIIDDTIIFSYDYDEGNYIDLYNQFPIKDEIGKNLHGVKHTQDFKLTFNTKAVGVKYIITAEKLDGSTLDDEWVKHFLVNDGVDVMNCYRANNRIKTYNEYEMYKDNPKERIIYEGTITSSEASRGYKEFTYRMWVSEDLTINNDNIDYLSESRSFKTRINVYASK